MESIFKMAYKLNGRYVAILLWLVLPQLYGQEVTKKPFFIEKGFIIGAGNGIDSINVPEGYYNPLFFMGHFGMDIARKKNIKRPNRGIFTLFLEPQVNPVFIRKNSSLIKDLEFGVNVGVQHMFPIYKSLYTFITLSTGPHYITVHTEKQHRGFIFSDNLSGGVYYFISKEVAVNVAFRLRHISNANLAMPNGGINTFNGMIGVSKVLR